MFNPLSVLMSSILQQLIHLLTLINVLFDTDQATVVHVHWNLCNLTPQFSDIRQKIYDPKEFLWTKIKPEYCNILCNPTYFPGPLVYRIGFTVHISLVPWCIELDSFHCSYFPGPLVYRIGFTTYFPGPLVYRIGFTVHVSLVPWCIG